MVGAAVLAVMAASAVLPSRSSASLLPLLDNNAVNETKCSFHINQSIYFLSLYVIQSSLKERTFIWLRDWGSPGVPSTRNVLAMVTIVCLLAVGAWCVRWLHRVLVWWTALFQTSMELLHYYSIENCFIMKRTRKSIYFHPPFSISVKTNVIKMFLNPIAKHFPKNHKLYKCFNRNTVKATYCTLTNMKQWIGIRNAKVWKVQKTNRSNVTVEITRLKTLQSQLPE